MPALIAFPAGLILGSFLTALAHRLPRGESFVAGRSRCPACGARIAAYDNIPVVSWLLLRGRCRSCDERIPARYPLTELGLGALYLATVLILGDAGAGELALGLVLCTVLVAITLTDLDLRVIPNPVLLAGAIAAVAIAAIADPASLPERAIAAIAAGGALFVVALVYPRGLGMGDVKLVAMMGLFLGRSIAPALLIGFAAGAVAGAALIARHGSAARKHGIPFGPFLALGGVVGLWFGGAIVDWYADQFLAAP
ncbi:MAG TPA: prepilin peptidase [Solirubrobacterales bacterium]|nr:prepilin peptidase [Solirubrobacterales bacterium]